MEKFDNIQDIKEEIKRNVGKDIKLEANLGRRKMYVSTGTIEQVYPSIFLVRLDNEARGKLTFSYSDVLTEIVTLSYKN